MIPFLSASDLSAMCHESCEQAMFLLVTSSKTNLSLARRSTCTVSLLVPLVPVCTDCKLVQGSSEISHPAQGIRAKRVDSQERLEKRVDFINTP